MSTKRRRVPEAVQVHLERRARLTASMAERQSAALGKTARERLKPLLAASPVAEEKPQIDLGSMSSDMFKRITEHWASALQSSVFFQPSSMWSGISSFVVEYPAPTIDAAKLEALRGAVAYKPQPRIPDMVQVLTGWRGWKLKDGLLGALGTDAVWPAREALRAMCKNQRGESHLAPHWDCQCGIWAFKDLDKLIAAIGSDYRGLKVIGSVSLWGRVIETENGYRAQYGYPSELWLMSPDLEELGSIYDVPVRCA